MLEQFPPLQFSAIPQVEPMHKFAIIHGNRTSGLIVSVVIVLTNICHQPDISKACLVLFISLGRVHAEIIGTYILHILKLIHNMTVQMAIVNPLSLTSS